MSSSAQIEESELVELVSQLMKGYTDAATKGDAFPAVATQLGDQGLWCPMAPSEIGGADLPFDLGLRYLRALASRWPALAWASAQANAVAAALERTAGEPSPLAEVISGTSLVSVAGHSGPASTVARVDSFGSPELLVLVDREGESFIYRGHGMDVYSADGSGLAGTTPSVVSLRSIPDALAARVGDCRRWLALSAAAVACGVAEDALARSRSYASDRRQFGQLLIEIPIVRRRIEKYEELVATVWSRIVERAGSSESGLALDVLDVLDVTLTVAIDTCAIAVQTLGGYGYIREYQVEENLRDVLSLRASTAWMVESP
ncbi:acyl-CoA dehydrogenase family protein [Nocardioides endophyticus]|uniref:Acyl-CoA dehydrogenase family protein n=1 Tax=Nocardioides endophyticus TaxID=1353775 RepID=A0ABP8YEN5_9ACTN